MGMTISRSSQLSGVWSMVLGVQNQVRTEFRVSFILSHKSCFVTVKKPVKFDKAQSGLLKLLKEAVYTFWNEYL